MGAVYIRLQNQLTGLEERKLSSAEFGDVRGGGGFVFGVRFAFPWTRRDVTASKDDRGCAQTRDSLRAAAAAAADHSNYARLPPYMLFGVRSISMQMSTKVHTPSTPYPLPLPYRADPVFPHTECCGYPNRLYVQYQTRFYRAKDEFDGPRRKMLTGFWLLIQRFKILKNWHVRH